MRIFVDQQLEVFIQSILLGLAVGVVHDLLRPLRLRLPKTAWILDSGYCLAAALCLFLFCLNRTQGQLQIYAVIGMCGGAVLFFTLFSDLLRPIWDFWADNCAFFVRMAAMPLVALKRLCKKIGRQLKNTFLFAKKCFTIRKIGARRRGFHKGGRVRGTVKTARQGAENNKGRKTRQTKKAENPLGSRGKGGAGGSSGGAGMADVQPSGEGGTGAGAKRAAHTASQHPKAKQ
jgi:hypothetical protein